MCGHAGMMGYGIQATDLAAFKELLWVTALRGPHSTGVMTYSSSKSHEHKPIDLRKRVGSSSTFLYYENIAPKEEKQLESVWLDIVMGHCRYATVGKINDANAHPFDTGRYISCHNGTLRDKEFEHDDKTDSEMMFEKMEKEGIKETLGALDSLSAFATVIFDKSNHTVSFARNAKRTLFFGVVQNADLMFWSSEKEMLDLIASRNFLDMKTYYLDTDKLYTIHPADVKAGKIPWQVESIQRIKRATPFTMPPALPWVEEGDTVPTIKTVVTDLTPSSTGSSTTETTSKGIMADFSSFIDKLMASEKKDPVNYTRPKTKRQLKKEAARLEKVERASQKMDNYCCVCGGRIANSDLLDCEDVEIEGETYYTCLDCTAHFDNKARRVRRENDEEEVRVG